MIGFGLQKLAKENGMRISGGVAYGSYQGFAVTFSEGAGYKRVDFAVRFENSAQKAAFMDAVDAAGIQRTYLIRNMGLGERRIQIFFADSFGTMKRIRAFLAWFVPVLRQFGASGYNICPHCGCDVSNGRWILMDGTAYCMHDSCAQNLAAQLNAGNERRREEESGSYITGAIGAVLGAAIGAVLWAVILMAGYVASLAGLFIGLLSQKGYDLLKGKQGKGKIAILIVAIVLGVLLGTFGGYVAAFLNEFGSEDGFAHVAQLAMKRLLDNPTRMAKDLLLGFVFAALGVYSILRNTGRAVADDKFVYLP